MAYVQCPETITSPVADERGMTPNQPCPERCAVLNEGPTMLFRCARGHLFIATPADVKRPS